MPTIAEQLTQLTQDRDDLVDNLTTKGITGLTGDETFTELVPEVLNIPSGGGTEKEYFVKVVDYDGTILKEETLDDGETFTLPTPPTHSGLVFQEWSSTQQITNNTITINGNDAMIGAIYTTTSGLTEFDVKLTSATGLSVTCNLDGTKNWGDGTSDTETSHTYQSAGEYIIACDATELSTNGVFGQSTGSLNKYCLRARITGISIITANSFAGCKNLQTVTLSNNVTKINERAFAQCDELINFNIPLSCTKVLSYIFDSCTGLEYVVIPYTTYISTALLSGCQVLKNFVFTERMTTIQDSTLSSCNSIRKLTIPNFVSTIYYNFAALKSLEKVIFKGSIGTLPSNFLQEIINLKEIKMPTNLTKINNYSFMADYNLKIVDFSNATSVPTLGSYCFMGLKHDAKIIVPDNLYDSWVTATNWKDIADKIIRVSDL